MSLCWKNGWSPASSGLLPCQPHTFLLYRGLLQGSLGRIINPSFTSHHIPSHHHTSTVSTNYFHVPSGVAPQRNLNTNKVLKVGSTTPLSLVFLWCWSALKPRIQPFPSHLPSFAHIYFLVISILSGQSVRLQTPDSLEMKQTFWAISSAPKLASSHPLEQHLHSFPHSGQITPIAATRFPTPQVFSRVPLLRTIPEPPLATT